MIQRVIVNRENEREYIVEGLPYTTFRDACIENWPFKGIGQRSKWIINDERGNDITSEPLESYNGIAFIVGTIMSFQEIQMREQWMKESNSTISISSKFIFQFEIPFC
jgi:hypothetical protein